MTHALLKRLRPRNGCTGLTRHGNSRNTSPLTNRLPMTLNTPFPSIQALLRGKKLVGAAMAGLLLLSQAAAQPLAGPTLATQEKQWQSCEGGYYTGPRAGRRNWSNDKYLWVVTPDFAKRFCMPEHMVSRELKGAEAIAFRMVDGADSDRCGSDDDGKANCLENSVARFEIYLPQSLNLPAANPEVKFFEDARTTSDWHIGDKERSARGTAYRQGKYQLAPGQTPRYRNPYVHPDPGHQFGLIYAHEGKGRWPVSPLWEVGFRGDWNKGLDMLILQNQLGFATELRHYEAEKVQQGTRQGQYLIVMDKRDSQSGGKRSWEKSIPEEHAHVIYLPHDFGQIVRQAAMSRSNWQDFIKTYQQR